MDKLPYINLGCGNNFHDQWVNIDFISHNKHVIEYDLLKGIPFPDNNFEFVYHSHVLEHFPKEYAAKFIKECYRILKPGGFVRIAIPDLEQIALNYIKYLNQSLENIPGADSKYEWTLLEMYDQVVREKSGGEMIEYIKDTSKMNDEFLLQRNGREAEALIKLVRGTPQAKIQNSIKQRLFSGYRNRLRMFFLRILISNDIGYKKDQFRNSGEVHKWMYDRYSLKKILESVGFTNVVSKSAFTSYLPNWDKYNLDGQDRIVRKPDSLFMEGMKQ